jgi:beta-glucosidase
MTDYPSLISQLSLTEKAGLCSGADFWTTKAIERCGIPSILMTDGPHGLRKQIGATDQLDIKSSEPATCFPPAVTLGSTWNVKLIEAVGGAMGEEALAQGISVILGPGANLKRSPLCGRNFEYFAEDPLLSGEMASAMIQGIQSKGVGASLKHFAANNQESDRMVVDARIDERALRELYLAGFERAVKHAKPWTVMAAYNQVNGTYACEHARLLTSILRNEWGFEGLVVSDWGGVNDRVEGLKAGLDLQMPGTHGLHDKQIVQAVQKGHLSQRVLDDAVMRNLKLIERGERHRQPKATFDAGAHHELAKRAAVEGIVLLKNGRSTLPITPSTKFALIGELARTPRYQGAGSSLINPLNLVSMSQALTQRGRSVPFASGYRCESPIPDQNLLDEAVALAKQAEVSVVVIGLTDDFESEGFDRSRLDLPESHNALISALAKTSTKLVVVLCNGSPVILPWIDQADAVVEAYLGGEAGGEAIWSILFGEENPSGKLAESFPLDLAHVPCASCFPMGPKVVDYRESLYVGYRYYDTVHAPVLFPFGYGLSYTSFAYHHLQVSRHYITQPELLVVSVEVTNTGTRAGQDVVQLYVHDVKSSVFKPVHELRGFAKISLKPGETGQVQFTLDGRAFSHYDVQNQAWLIESGDFELRLGTSSRDIRLTDIVTVHGEVTSPLSDAFSPEVYLRPLFPPAFDASSFEALLGRSAMTPEIDRPGTYTPNSRLVDIEATGLGRFIVKQIRHQAAAAVEAGDPRQQAMVDASIGAMPLRNLITFGGGKITLVMINTLVKLLNAGHPRSPQ